MYGKLFITTLLLSLHATYSYILLTASLDDFHSIAKQIAASPVGIQIHNMFRKASQIFTENGDQGRQGPRARANAERDQDPNLEVWVPDKKEKDSSDESLSEADEAYLKTRGENQLERRMGNDVVALGKNASYYLQSLRKIFESV